MDKKLADFRTTRRKELFRSLKWPVAIMVWSFTAFCVAMFTTPSSWQWIGDTLVQVEWILTANIRIAIAIQFVSTLLIGFAGMLVAVRLRLWNTGLDTKLGKRYSALIKTEASARWKLRQKWEREAERGSESR